MPKSSWRPEQNCSFDYQSDRHCSKTCNERCAATCLFDYQSDRHCSKTVSVVSSTCLQFDYQSDRHCSKTWPYAVFAKRSLITSQIDTAPKPRAGRLRKEFRLITSQIDTAPKPCLRWPWYIWVWLPVRSTLLQNTWRYSRPHPKVWLPVRSTLLQNRDVR